MRALQNLQSNNISMDRWFVENLVCPIDKLPLEYSNNMLVSARGRKYPVVEGVPVMLADDVTQTLWVASASLTRARRSPDGEIGARDLYLDTLGVSEAERVGIHELSRSRGNIIDPVVAYLIGATGGYAYRHLIGNLNSYPIPDLRLPDAKGDMFLDLGCNWGRWCIAAARKGYSAIGIDPSLGAILAARRVATQLGLPIRYLVADARYLPFKRESFNTVFSYSVLQHLDKPNVRRVLADVARVLTRQGVSLIQMPNFLGLRSLYHQARRGFREARDFEVRYWSIPELKREFGGHVGKSEVLVDCYFGLGLQQADAGYMPPLTKRLLAASEWLRRLSERLPILSYLADSVYISSSRSGARLRPA